MLHNEYLLRTFVSPRAITIELLSTATEVETLLTMNEDITITSVFYSNRHS